MARLAHVAARSFVHQHDCHVLLHARYAYKMVEITIRHPLILFFVRFEIMHHPLHHRLITIADIFI